MNEGETGVKIGDIELGDLHTSISDALVRLETESIAQPKMQFAGEYPLSVLSDISGLSHDTLSKILATRNVSSTMHGYNIERVIGALRSYLDEEEEESVKMVA